jgi:2-polyprenyl-3-methyl-5-hydroxy-6-metoxy-1,4-benzoquinol methylase
MKIISATRVDVLDVCRRVAAAYPVIGGGLVDRHLAADDPAWVQAERALGYLRAKHPGGLDDVLEAFAIVSMDFLRLQARFMKTRRYARSDSSELVSDLYADDEKMSGYYLDGLAMTYVLWPNHARMIASFMDDFVPRLAAGARVVEVGVGHGLMAAMLFEAVPDLRYVGVDISPSSLHYAGSALSGLGVPADRWSMVSADALAGNLAGLAGGNGFDGLVCCEVLEHVDEPQLLLANLAASLRPGGVGFMSTVANMEAEDHVYLFPDVASIRQAFAASGWSIEQDRPNVLPGADSWDPLPVNYSGLFTPAVAQPVAAHGG